MLYDGIIAMADGINKIITNEDNALFEQKVSIFDRLVREIDKDLQKYHPENHPYMGILSLAEGWLEYIQNPAYEFGFMSMLSRAKVIFEK